MREALDETFSIAAPCGATDAMITDLVAGKSRLVMVVHWDAGLVALFGLQIVEGGFKVRRRNGRHVGSYADFDAALEAGFVTTAVQAA